MDTKVKKRMSKDIEELKIILVKIDNCLDNVDLTLVRNTSSLEHHIARTDALETYVKDVIVAKDLEPIKKHVNNITSALKGIGYFCVLIAGLAGFILTLKQIGVL